MTQEPRNHSYKNDPGGYIVGMPRTTDALGATLRGAFGAEPSLPREIALALYRLEKVAH